MPTVSSTGSPSAMRALTSHLPREDQTMLHFSDSKSMAKALRQALAERSIEISHSDSLELVARQFGFANWNMLAARIDTDKDGPQLPEGWIVSGQGRPNLYRVGLDPTQPGSVK